MKKIKIKDNEEDCNWSDNWFYCWVYNKFIIIRKDNFGLLQ